MKNCLHPKNLPVMTAVLGGIALVLRRLLYTFAVDEKNLLLVNHPLEIALGVLTGAALVYILVWAWKLEGSQRYADNFRAERNALIGHSAAAAGILITVLTKAPMMPGYLGSAWKALGCASPVCLFLAGYARLQGRKPFFLLHLVPCLFLVFHIVNHYQVWSGNPQFQDYGYALFGAMALVFFSFYTTSFDVDAGRRRMQLGMGLAAVYLCIAELAMTEYGFLYLGGALWALTDLCSLTSVPKPMEEEA